MKATYFKTALASLILVLVVGCGGGGGGGSDSTGTAPSVQPDTPVFISYPDVFGDWHIMRFPNCGMDDLLELSDAGALMCGGITEPEGTYIINGVNIEFDQTGWFSGVLTAAHDSSTMTRNILKGIIKHDKDLIFFIDRTADRYEFVSLLRKETSYDQTSFEGSWYFLGINDGPRYGKFTLSSANQVVEGYWHDSADHSLTGYVIYDPDYAGRLDSHFDIDASATPSIDLSGYLALGHRHGILYAVDHFYYMFKRDPGNTFSIQDLAGTWYFVSALSGTDLGRVINGVLEIGASGEITGGYFRVAGEAADVTLISGAEPALTIDPLEGTIIGSIQNQSGMPLNITFGILEAPARDLMITVGEYNGSPQVMAAYKYLP